MTIKVPRWLAPLLLMGLFSGIVGTVVATTAEATGNHGKVGVCHRTGSESNPYTFISVPKDEADGHITGTSKQHNEKVTWNEDGTWRGVSHKAGDERLDYYAPGGKGDCNETQYPSTSTTGTTTSTTTTSVPSTTSSTSSTTSSTTSTTSTTTVPTTTTSTTTVPTTTSSTTTIPTSPTSTTTTPETTTSTTTSPETMPSTTSSPTTTGHIKNTVTITPRRTTPATTYTPPDELAFTGVNNLGRWVLVGIAVLAAGACLIYASRARKH